MPPQTLHKLGLDYEALCAVKPDIILTTATAFGSDDDSGHRVGFDGVGQAMSGAVHISGLPENPMKVMVPVVDFSTALACALGTVVALYERRSSGRGQKVEASLLQMGLNLASGALIEEAVLGLNRQATGNRSPIAGPSDIFRVRRRMDHRAGDRAAVVQALDTPDRPARADRRSTFRVTIRHAAKTATS